MADILKCYVLYYVPCIYLTNEYCKLTCSKHCILFYAIELIMRPFLTFMLIIYAVIFSAMFILHAYVYSADI